ncbi:MAG: hypothetical protein J7J21_03795 [Methanomicrobia archaeon]|nr:hypothetical protein [Methanomicrobia archaeon]
MRKEIRESAVKTLNNFKQSFPILIGVLLLMSLLITAIPKEYYAKVFTGNSIVDLFAGAVSGSIAAGNPLNSYIIGGELLKQGISLIAVTAFILTWTTVGIIQLPAEAVMLGRKFAVTRNIVSFVIAMIIASLTVFTLGML